MQRQRTTPAKLPTKPQRQHQFDISSWYGGELIVNAAGDVRCYLGYISNAQPQSLSWYSPCVALRDEDGLTSCRFVELRGGLLRKTSLPRSEDHYRPLVDRWLELPRGADSFFGVVDRKTRDMDEELTRRLFGGTRADIDSIAKALSRVVGRSYHEMAQLPRVTFSKTRINSCDLTGCLIPKDFPYLAFDQSQYAWSHVSLHGFYRLLGFLCPSRSAIRDAIERSDVENGVLDRLLKAGQQYGEPLPYPSFE